MNAEILKQYEASRKGVVWRDLSARGKVRVTGPDRITFLHAMISNEVEGLDVGEGRYGTFLTATGKILADFHYYRFSEFVLIDLSWDLLGGLLENLEKFIIMDDVSMEDISNAWGHVALEGPKSKEVLELVMGDTAPSEPYTFTSVIWRGESLWWIRKDELALPGYEIILPKNICDEFLTIAVEEGAEVGMEKLSSETCEILRLERGIPLYGVDFTEKNNPVEAGLENAYSLTKGCYAGQEVVSKAIRVGSVPKSLSRMKLEGRSVPERGTAVASREGEEIGKITSAVMSPLLGCPIAFGFLKRGFWTPGQVHWVGGLKAEVVERF